MKKKCERCKRPAIRDSRYCFMCKDDVRYELTSSHYLTHIPQREFRFPGAAEKRSETHDRVDQ